MQHQLRRCNCGGGAHAGVAPTEVAPPHVAPTRAILLHLSNFAGLDQDATHDTHVLHAQAPHLDALLTRSTSMRLQWREEEPAVAVQPPPQTTTDDHRAQAAIVRMLGLSAFEHAASLDRARHVSAAQVASGVAASPAAAYPPLFGRLRVEVATNHLGVHEAVRARLASQRRAEPSAARHLHMPVFLEPQVAMQPPVIAQHRSPFLTHPRPPMQCLSSVPLTDEQHRARYIQFILQHVGERLALRTPATSIPPQTVAATPAAASAPHTPHAHMLVLHIDAHALLGPTPSQTDLAQHRLTGRRFVDQLLAALMTQLGDEVTPAASSATTQAANVPHASTCLHAAATPSHSHTASSLLDSPASPRLLWAVIIDSAESGGAADATTSGSVDAATALRHRMLAALRPAQTYQVQDGVIDRRTEGWSGCSAFIWHRDSTRVPLTATDSAVSASTPRTLTQGRLHLAHFIREIVFKLGLGSKYGA